MEYLKGLMDARDIAAPLVTITSPDVPAAIRHIKERILRHEPEAPILLWDCTRGYTPETNAGKTVYEQYLSNLTMQPGGAPIMNPALAMIRAQSLPKETIIIAQGIGRALMGSPVDITQLTQAICNLREPFKADGRMLVMISPTFSLPVELEGDVIPLADPLPDTTSLEKILRKTHNDFKRLQKQEGIEVADINDERMPKYVAALRGLSGFSAETIAALSLDSLTGYQEETLWTMKKEAVKKTQGLSVWEGPETFGSIGGSENLKQFGRRLLYGKKQYNVIVFMDELEKTFAGTKGDSSGVAQEMHGTFLQWSEDTKADGFILLGPPGSGKSAVAKAMGKESGIPTLVFDLTAMKGSHVGESGANLRRAFEVVNAIGDCKTLMIGTSNDISSLSPELRRRFKLATFFVDLPNETERECIWGIYLRKHGLPEECDRPQDAGWTGAEIEQCCQRAWQFGINLTDAAKYIIPISVSAKDDIEALRISSSGKYLSAATDGTWMHTPIEHNTAGGSRRIRSGGNR